MPTEEALRYSRVAADTVAAALRYGRSEMPEASEVQLLLMILGNAAACLGRLRVHYKDAAEVFSGMYDNGLQLEPLLGPNPRFMIDD